MVVDPVGPASAGGGVVNTALVPAHIDQAKVLATLGLNVNDPKAQAALLVCQRYGLDPLLRHVQLIQGSIYVTRDGFLHVAHQSGVLDGLELLEEGETDTYYWAKVAVYRKDMTHAFVATARCRKNEKTFADPWDQAIVRAERRALKRAFDVSGLTSEGDYDEHEELFDRATGEVTAPKPELVKPAQRFEEPPLPDEPMNAETKPWPDLKVDVPAPQLGLADGEPMRKLFAMLKGAGLESDEQRHELASSVLGRTVTTFTTFTADDATACIDALKPTVDQ